MSVFWPKKSGVFLVPPGAYRFSGLPRAARDRFYDKKNDFYNKKIRNTGISSETTIPGISSETAAPCYHVVTDFPFYGFFKQGPT